MEKNGNLIRKQNEESNNIQSFGCSMLKENTTHYIKLHKKINNSERNGKYGIADTKTKLNE